jgi:hypothetical protein
MVMLTVITPCWPAAKLACSLLTTHQEIIDGEAFIIDGGTTLCNSEPPTFTGQLSHGVTLHWWHCDGTVVVAVT